jgi:hypothetical protein
MILTGLNEIELTKLTKQALIPIVANPSEGLTCHGSLVGEGVKDEYGLMMLWLCRSG